MPDGLFGGRLSELLSLRHAPCKIMQDGVLTVRCMEYHAIP